MRLTNCKPDSCLWWHFDTGSDWLSVSCIVKYWWQTCLKLGYCKFPDSVKDHCRFHCRFQKLYWNNLVCITAVGGTTQRSHPSVAWSCLVFAASDICPSGMLTSSEWPSGAAICAGLDACIFVGSPTLCNMCWVTIMAGLQLQPAPSHDAGGRCLTFRW